MSKPAFEVFPYDGERLFELIAEGSHGKFPEDIRTKQQSGYFEKYLVEIGARTIIVERNYIDRDFLEDYAAYYVRCFPPYQKACLRLHFFSSEFTQQAFSKCISGDETQVSQDTLRKTYRGFVVIKPLPQTVFGRTCLATYPANGTREFPAARSFSAHLFGIELEVDRTLPFQEQDSVVAACATSALWTVFQATSRHYLHQVLSPVEITRAATHLLPAETRVLPNRGLSTHMMAHAIRSVALEPYLIRVRERHLLQAAIYSYVHARMPLVLGVQLIDDLGGGNHKTIGMHALTVIGYSLAGNSVPIGGAGLRLRATRMDKIYVHDDQVGPFARMELDGITLPVNGAATETLSTSWPSANKVGGRVRAAPDILLVPLYHKIRISWDWVLLAISALDEFLKDLSKAIPTVKLETLEWDVYLSNVNDVKKELLRHEAMNGSQKLAATTRSMPRFLWRATALRENIPVFDVLYDATDIDTGDALIQCLVFDDLVRGILVEIAKDAAFKKTVFPKGVKQAIQWVHDAQ